MTLVLQCCKYKRSVSYLFIDQNPSDKIIPSLVVKVISEELSNLRRKDKPC